MKKPLSYLLKICLVCLLLCVFSASALAAYSDMAGHPAAAAVERWSDLSVLQGSNGCFRPNDSIIRGEMALILDRIFLYEKQASNTFTDLEQTWYTDAVLQLNAAGIMKGSNNLMRPKDGITREEAAVMIARALGMDQKIAQTTPGCTDAATISSWAQNEIAVLMEAGALTDGLSLFRPKDKITRAETTVWLDELIGQVWRSSGLYNSHISGNAVIAANQAMLLNTTIEGDLIIAGGNTSRVILQNTTVEGEILNRSNANITAYAADEINSSSFFFGTNSLAPLADVAVNPYAARDFSLDLANRLWHPEAVSTGIDVSEWQGDINWQAVAVDGIDFAFIRCGYRGTDSGNLYADSKYDANMAQAANAGVRTGIYLFSQAITPVEAIQEAEMALSMAAGYDVTMPIAFDWETSSDSTWRSGKVSKATLTDCAIAFCETIRAAGYTPLIYLYSNTAYLRFDLSRLTDYDIWYCQPNTTPEYYYDFDVWQYSHSSSVAGIKGDVDMNLCFKEY